MTESDRAAALVREHPIEHHEVIVGAMPVYAGRSAGPSDPSRSSASWAKLAATIALRHIDLICIAAIIGIYFFTMYQIGRL